MGPYPIQMGVWCASATDVQPRERKTGCARTDDRESSDAPMRQRIRAPLDKGPVNGRPPYDLGQRSVIAPNLLDRQFEADGPNQKWLADFTYLPSGEGWLYLAVVLDLYSRMVVGWSMQRHTTTQRVADAMTMAV